MPTGAPCIIIGGLGPSPVGGIIEFGNPRGMFVGGKLDGGKLDGGKLVGGKLEGGMDFGT